MAGEEIGFRELRQLVGRSWKLIVGLAALGGLLAFAVLQFAVAATYESSVRLIAQPLPQGIEGGRRPTSLYTSLLRSDSVLGKTFERLSQEGVLAEGETLVYGENLGIQARGEAGETVVISLIAEADDPERAARIANAWAEVFTEESREMLMGGDESSSDLLQGELAPTRERLAELESRRSEILEEYRQLEETTSTSWDQRISAARKKAELALADYQSETRRVMEEAVARHLPEGEVPGLAAVRRRLLEIVSARAQLAQTPRVLTLEKAASDETLAELIAEGGDAERFDRTLVSQELNPLHDQLSVHILELESEIEALAGEGGSIDVSPILALLEKIQRERAAGLVSLGETQSLEVRTLRRRRGRELEKISEQRELALAAVRVELERLAELEKRLSARFNQTLLSDLLQRIDPVSVASSAAPQPQPRSRGVAIKVAAAVFLGGMLGLMIALFRSAGA